MLSDRLKNLSTTLKDYEQGKPIPAGMVPKLRREIEAAIDQAAAMENTPIPLNQRLNASQLGERVTLFPVIPRLNGGGQ